MQTSLLNNHPNNDWSEQLTDLFQKNYYQKLLNFLTLRQQSNITIFPATERIFSAFELSNFKYTKVVIIGQDPYHNEGQAHGLSFSVPTGIKTPPSLKNIFKELTLDLNIVNHHGNLESWTRQGVLLLNSILTVEHNAPKSHINQGWEAFTDDVIKILSNKKQHLVFMLWGQYAQKKAELIDTNKHLILTSYHPSPLSAHKGFLGCQHFSKTNEYLKAHNQKIINWQL